jgi:type VI secretion system secreted protein Hcp
MPEQWFLKVDGIAGESTAARHAKEIDVESWSFGASAGLPGAGSGAGSGRPTLDPFVVETRMSVATPALLRACVTGTHIRSATLTGTRSGGRGMDIVTYAMSDVLVTSARHGDTATGVPFDRFTLGFQTLTITYRPQAPNGAAGPAISVTVTS